VPTWLDAVGFESRKVNMTLLCLQRDSVVSAARSLADIAIVATSWLKSVPIHDAREVARSSCLAMRGMRQD
jgi:hypothetical protein